MGVPADSSRVLVLPLRDGSTVLISPEHPHTLLDALRQLATTPGIASGWQRKILDRLAWLEKQPGQTAPPTTAFHVKPEDL